MIMVCFFCFCLSVTHFANILLFTQTSFFLTDFTEIKFLKNCSSNSMRKKIRILSFFFFFSEHFLKIKIKLYKKTSDIAKTFSRY